MTAPENTICACNPRNGCAFSTSAIARGKVSPDEFDEYLL